MTRITAISFLFLVVLGVVETRAQTREKHSVAARAISADERVHIVVADTSSDLRTRPVTYGRVGVTSGVSRAVYRIDTEISFSGSPETVARAYLKQTAAEFGLDPSTEDLEVVEVKRGRYSSHVTFRQTFRGLPVYNRQVKVNLDRNGQPTMVISGYASHLADRQPLDINPLVPESEVITRTKSLFTGVTVLLGEPELNVYPSPHPRLIWRFIAWVQDPSAEWEILLDAHSGEVVQLFEQSTHAHVDEDTDLPDVETVSPSVQLLTDTQQQNAVQGVRAVDGSGLVFLPDPLTTAGVEYGPPYVDRNDEDIPELNAQRKEVVLRDITLDDDQLYRLRGPYVQISGNPQIGGSNYTPPEEPEPNLFQYGRASDYFEAVMSYYHIDTSQRYVQSLNLGFDIQADPVLVNPHGLGGKDDSKYYPAQKSIAFGTGGIDDAEDADVIWHEYGHALIEASAPGLRYTEEGQALHEGWADYWAASFSRSMIENGDVPPRDWSRIFDWDGNYTWNGRVLDRFGHYPEDVNCEDLDDTERDGCDIYEDGLFWATALMEIYSLVGRTVCDRLNLASHVYLSHPVTFIDAAEALLQADNDLYAGAHRDVLLSVLGARGLVDASQTGPNIVHDPEANVTTSSQSITISARVTGRWLDRDHVHVFFNSGNDWVGPVGLTPAGDDWFTVEIPAPEYPGLFRYYLEASDQMGQSVHLPRQGSDRPYQFTMGMVEKENIFRVAGSTGRWRLEGNSWSISSVHPDSLSGEASLVLTPVAWPANATQLLLLLDHTYKIGEGLGANLKVSDDDGRTWNILLPEENYPGLFNGDTNGEPAFVGSTGSGGTLTAFDLSGYSGKQILIRLDFLTSRRLESSEFWRVVSGTIYRSTFDAGFEIPVDLALHPNYPNPFSNSTTITYTLPSSSSVNLEMYDMLGKRIAVLENGWRESGTYNLTLNGTHFAAGVYMLRLTAGDQYRVRSMTILR